MHCDKNNCDNCNKYLEDEVIKIGLDEIKIYYLINTCMYYSTKIINANHKARLLFKDMIIDSYDEYSTNIFLFLDKNDNFEMYYDDFERLINNKFHIYIIE